MEILVNGTPHQVPADASVAQLLELLGLQGKRLAVEINRELVPRSEFDNYLLQPHDTVEIVHAIGGG